jgi:hypothetical protein
MATRYNYGPTCQIPSNSEVYKYMKFNFIQIWLQMVLWFLIQISFQILKSCNKENCSLFNFLHVHISIWDFYSTRRQLYDRINSNWFEKYLNNLKVTLFKSGRPTISLPACVRRSTVASPLAVPSPRRSPHILSSLMADERSVVWVSHRCSSWVPATLVFLSI